jgi:alcohol dehydrogenase class IV
MAETWLYVPSKSIFGTGSLNRLGSLAAEQGDRALIVAESSLTEYGSIDRVKEVLRAHQMKSIIFSEINNTTTSGAVQNAAALALSSKSQMVIGLGGVHALSIAKSAAKTAGSGQDIDELLSGAPPREGGLPYFEVSTTCRNPFQYTDRAFLVDSRNRKGTVCTLGLYPDAVITDPELTLSLSPKFTATTLLDTLLLAIEGFISKKSSFLSDTLLLQVCKPLLFLMKSAVLEPKNIEYREKAAQFGYLTALGLASTSYGLGSAMSLVLGGRFSLPHSWIASILLPHILEWSNTVIPDRIFQLVQTVQEDKLGSPLRSNTEFIDFTRYTVASMRLPMRLHALQIDFPKIAACIPNIRGLEGTAYLPVPVSEEDIYNLLERAY